MSRTSQGTQRKSLNRTPRTKRRCLKCDKFFMSEGKFNRLCDPCRKWNTKHYKFCDEAMQAITIDGGFIKNLRMWHSYDKGGWY
jgi:hypothetical protein